MSRKLIVALLLASGVAAAAGADIPPPNTERAEPDRPPSSIATDTLVAARAMAAPETPPAATLQLLDTVRQANFDSGSDELTSAARERLDAFVMSLQGAQVTRV